ncbi:hypothetical protein ACODT3_10555 [Streptomyces sp. 4.24]|uniref:hypothetical protein n=1 Tax=Streptomyces tritrimontium TaxID=3406573 RepID=UPI003BB7434F
MTITCSRCGDTDGPHSDRGNNGWLCEGCLPWKRAKAREYLLFMIRIEGGEWTVGRVKALYRKALPTHIWRATIRRDLKDLAASGRLIRHDDPARRYYTFNWERP